MADHYEYPQHVLVEEARKYAQRPPPMPQFDYFTQALCDAVEHMWAVMARACNHPERWNEILSTELDRWRPPSHNSEAQAPSTNAETI